MKRPLVYICSRFSGDVVGNTEKARVYSRFAAGRDTVPIAPHLLLPQFLDEATERPLAMKLDLELLKRCDEIWVFCGENGVSDGMLEEIHAAETNYQPIRYFTEDLKEI